MTFKRSPSGSAFTLVEVLVTVALLAIVTLALVGMLTLALQYWRKNNTRLAIEQTSRTSLNFMGNDFHQCCRLNGASDVVQPLPPAGTKSNFLVFSEPAPATLALATSNPTSLDLTQASTYQYVAYYLQDGSGAWPGVFPAQPGHGPVKLVREVVPGTVGAAAMAGNPPFGGTAETVLDTDATGLMQLTFSYEAVNQVLMDVVAIENTSTEGQKTYELTSFQTGLSQ